MNLRNNYFLNCRKEARLFRLICKNYSLQHQTLKSYYNQKIVCAFIDIINKE